jgi:hypothetical protein
MKRFLLIASVAAALTAACGGGGSGGSPLVDTEIPTASNTTVQVNLGDGPADRLLAVGMTVDSLTFSQANGGSVSVMTSPRPIELMHLMGTVTPLALSSVPQGTYTGATMTFGNATVTHLDAATGVNLDSTTQLTIDTDGVDLSGLPFTPRFDLAHLSKGQAVVAWSSAQIEHDGHGMGGMPSGGTVSASSIILNHQGLRGTVSGYASNGTQASFTLTMPADSAFAALTGATTVTVHQQGSTQLRGLASVENGMTVQVRGLLFIDSGALRLVASRLVAN